MVFIEKLLNSIYQLLFQVNFTDLTFSEVWQKYLLIFLSLYLTIRLITMVIGFVIKFIKGVLSC